RDDARDHDGAGAVLPQPRLQPGADEGALPVLGHDLFAFHREDLLLELHIRLTRTIGRKRIQRDVADMNDRPSGGAPGVEQPRHVRRSAARPAPAPISRSPPARFNAPDMPGRRTNDRARWHATT